MKLVLKLRHFNCSPRYIPTDEAFIKNKIQTLTEEKSTPLGVMTGACVPKSSPRHCSYTRYNVLTQYTQVRERKPLGSLLWVSLGGGERRWGAAFDLKEYRQILELFIIVLVLCVSSLKGSSSFSWLSLLVA